MADDSPQEIAAKFLDKLKSSPFVMIGLNDGQHSEPMTAQIDDDQPNTLFFFAGRDNRIAGGGEAMAQFVGKGRPDISLSGRVKMLFGGTIRSDESSSHAVVGSVA